MKNSGIIYLEDGTTYLGDGFGSKGTTVGEIVFNTSMIGYQEVLEDVSNAGYIVNMTYPWIGNYGIQDTGGEMDIHTKGLIVKDFNLNPSNYKSISNIDEYMKKRGIVGVASVDTRAITKKIRKSGRQKCVISNEELSISEMEKLIKDYKSEENYVEKVSVKSIEQVDGSDLNIGILDLGDSKGLKSSLGKMGYKLTIFPYNSTVKEIEQENIDGLIISNGPGSVDSLKGSEKLVRELSEKNPIFGIGLGHQLIASAFGASVEKMKYGHRGSNHGVYDINKDRAYIVPQNHGYVVNLESLEGTDLVITHKNLNDDTVEGIAHKSLSVNSVQFNLEEKTDLENTSYLLDDFVKTLKEVK